MKNVNYRILNLEGSYIVKRELNEDKEMVTTYEYDTSKRKVNKMYTCTMPFSLETYRAFNLIEGETWKDDKDDKDVFTKLFVNLKFNYNFWVDEETTVKDSDGNITKDDEGKDIIKKTQFEINKKKLREILYTTNIKIDGIEYCYFKRGASKARQSNVIFVKAQYYYQLYTPCLLGLQFDEGGEYDVTSREAYTSLIMSGIIKTMEITKDQILIINDLESPEFEAMQSLTLKDDIDGVYQVEDKYKVVNNMTDGEGLMDISMYTDENNEVLLNATTALLRNDFTKVNVCRTRLQDYYKENNITTVYDAWRRPHVASKIKLVITPSSCKFLKFKNQYDNDDMKAYDNWLEKIPTTFGIVKTDHAGNYKYANRLSYQMLNSMNLNHSEVISLMQDELDFLKLMKDNTNITYSDIKKMKKEDKKLNKVERNKMTSFMDVVRDDEIEGSTGEMISDLLSANSDFRFTNKFKNWKSKQLQDYLGKLRLGKIRIKNSLYAIMVNNPYEMMVATTKIDNNVDSCIQSGWEVYCPRFGDEELMMIRNPQINAGNIINVRNQYHDEYKWFGLYDENGKATHDFVVFTNSYNVDLMNRAQGCDWDVDSAYLTNCKLLCKKSKDSQAWNTPTNGIKGTNEPKLNTKKALAKLDNYLSGSTMTIGKIVNKSAIFNGYMYNGINNDFNDDYIKSCYDASSSCSSFSQIAIDMAKKDFNGLSLSGELMKLNKTTFVNDDDETEKVLKFDIDRENVNEITIKDYFKDLKKVESKDKKYKGYKSKYELVSSEFDLVSMRLKYNKLSEKGLNEKDRISIIEDIDKKIKVHMEKMIVPYFFTYIAKSNDYRLPTRMDCSMDYLEEILDDFDMKAMTTDKLDMENLFQMQKVLKGANFNANKVDDARKLISDCLNQLNKLAPDNNDSKEEKKKKINLRRWIKNTVIKELKELELNPRTIYKIVMRAFNVDKKYKGFELLKLDEGGNTITYKNKEEIESQAKYKELSEMTMTVLTMIYNSYAKDFLNCFKKTDDNIVTEKVKKVGFWE